MFNLQWSVTGVWTQNKQDVKDTIVRGYLMVTISARSNKCWSTLSTQVGRGVNGELTTFGDMERVPQVFVVFYGLLTNRYRIR